MTTSLPSPTRVVDPSSRSTASKPIPFARLVGVEWTKAIDTRSARWLFALVALATVGPVLVPVLDPTSFDQTWASYLRIAAIGLTIPLPVVAILLLTGEWSHRTVLTTFTQEPRRLRVVGAKLVVSVLLGIGSAAFGGLVTAAALGAAAASGRSLDADLSVGVVGGYVLFVALNVLAAVALGALLQSSAAAIAASFALPATIAVLGTSSSLIADWIDMATTWNQILENDWGGHGLRIACSIAFWVVIPLTAGIVRTLHRDIA